MLSSFKFNPKGLPVINKDNIPVVNLLIDPKQQRFTTDKLIPQSEYIIENHFPRPLKHLNQINTPNLLAFLGFNVCIVKDPSEDGRRTRPRRAVISTSRSWQENIFSTGKRRPLEVVVKGKVNKIPKRHKSYLDKDVKDKIIQRNTNDCLKEINMIVNNLNDVINDKAIEMDEEPIEIDDIVDSTTSSVSEQSNDNTDSIAFPFIDGGLEDELSEEE